MSLSKSKCWSSNNYLHFSKYAVPLRARVESCSILLLIFDNGPHMSIDFLLIMGAAGKVRST